MRKLASLVSLISLLAGTAQAADLSDLVAALQASNEAMKTESAYGYYEQPLLGGGTALQPLSGPPEAKYQLFKGQAHTALGDAIIAGANAQQRQYEQKREDYWMGEILKNQGRNSKTPGKSSLLDFYLAQQAGNR